MDIKSIEEFKSVRLALVKFELASIEAALPIVENMEVEKLVGRVQAAIETLPEDSGARQQLTHIVTVLTNVPYALKQMKGQLEALANPPAPPPVPQISVPRA